MKNLISTIFILFIAFCAVNAAQNVVKSPDRAIEVSVNTDNGIPTYSIKYNGKTFFKNSPLGLTTNVGDSSSGMTLDENVNRRNISETYQLRNIKKSSVNYNATEGVFSFSKNDKPAFDIVFRVSNNDVAFKYQLYPQGQRKSCVVNTETTGFVLPEGTTTFLCPQMKPMTGFARTAPSYETYYTADASTGENGWGGGYTFPCLFRLNDDGWMLISETGVDSRYCASRLLGHKDGMYTIGFPQEEENNGNGTSSPGIPLPGAMPWLTIILGEILKPIVETTVPFDVVEQRYEASQKYDYSKGSWSWIIKMDGNTTFPVRKNTSILALQWGMKLYW